MTYPSGPDLVWWAFVGGVTFIALLTVAVEFVLWLAAPRPQTAARS